MNLTWASSLMSLWAVAFIDLTWTPLNEPKCQVSLWHKLHKLHSTCSELGFQVPDLPLSTGWPRANDLTLLKSCFICKMMVLDPMISKFPSNPNILPASLPHRRCPTPSFFFFFFLLHDFVCLRIIKETLKFGQAAKFSPRNMTVN